MCCLSCSTIFWTAEYNTPRSFCLADYSDVFCDRCTYISICPLTTHTALQPLGATLRIIILPFLIPIRKLVLLGNPAPPVVFHAPWFPCRPVDTHSFPNTCFIVTSTGLLSERTLAGVSRLVYTNHLWRSYVGLPPLGQSPDLFFTRLGEPYLIGQ
jgi:hypothetical protein